MVNARIRKRTGVGEQYYNGAPMGLTKFRDLIPRLCCLGKVKWVLYLRLSFLLICFVCFFVFGQGGQATSLKLSFPEIKAISYVMG